MLFTSFLMITTSEAPLIGKWRPSSAKDVMDFYRAATPRRLTTVIETRYEKPTDTKGSAFRAFDLGTGDTVWTAYDYSLNTPENHLAAAMECVSEWRVADYQLLHWTANSRGDGMVFTFVIAEVR